MQKVSPEKIISHEEAVELRPKILSVLLDSIKQVKETDAGYLLRLGVGLDDLVLASDWIQIERLCNAFLRFSLIVESNEGAMSLDVAGPSGTKDFLMTELALSRWL